MNLKPYYPYLVGVGAATLALWWLLRVKNGSAGGSGWSFTVPDGLYDFATETAMPLGFTGTVVNEKGYSGNEEGWW